MEEQYFRLECCPGFEMRDESSLVESEDKAFEANYRAEIIRQINERLKLGTTRHLRIVRGMVMSLIDEPPAKDVKA